jgi:plastocyanin
MYFRLLAVCLLSLPILAPAATVDVTVGGGGSNFSPRLLTVTAGDTVRWTWPAITTA